MHGSSIRKILPLVLIVGVIAACIIGGLVTRQVYFAAGSAFWGFVVVIVYLLRPGSALSNMTVEDTLKLSDYSLETRARHARRDAGDSLGERRKRRRIAIAVCVAALIGTIAICTVPMSLSPVWNGKYPQWRNQYELLAESFLDGKLYIDYDDVDPRLAELENPYDQAQRKAANVKYHWDHAYYNGKYYVYFGVVPVLTTFLPYRLITGKSLTTYRATQLYTILFIIGLFALFHLLARLLFRRMPLSVFLALCVCSCMLSLWFATARPALYCTAITAGLACMIWSIHCYVRAFVSEERPRAQLAFAFVGAVLGALAFGCRPPVALANILAIPLFVNFCRRNEYGGRHVAKIVAIVAIPYVLVACGLMGYNYARFGSLTEFGQAYQITVADQHNYGLSLSRIDPLGILVSLFKVLFEFKGFSANFPFVVFAGCFVGFPILLFGLGVFVPKVRYQLSKGGLFGFGVALIVVPLIIILVDLLFSPYFLERYKLDFFYLMCLASFLAIGCIGKVLSEKTARVFGFAICLLAVLTCLASIAFFLVPFDKNVTYLYPRLLRRLGRVVSFGLL